MQILILLFNMSVDDLRYSNNLHKYNRLDGIRKKCTKCMYIYNDLIPNKSFKKLHCLKIALESRNKISFFLGVTNLPVVLPLITVCNNFQIFKLNAQ